jgi:hypothetical protein
MHLPGGTHLLFKMDPLFIAVTSALRAGSLAKLTRGNGSSEFIYSCDFATVYMTAALGQAQPASCWFVDVSLAPLEHRIGSVEANTLEYKVYGHRPGR